LAVVAAVAERGRVRLTATVETSISLIPAVCAAGLFGPLSALIVGAASLAGEFPPLLPAEQREVLATKKGSPYQRWRIYTLSRALSGAAIGMAAMAVESRVQGDTARVVAGIACASVLAEAFDVTFAALMAQVRRRQGAEVVRLVAPVALASSALYAPLVAALGVAYHDVSPWTLAFFFVPALAAQRLFALYQRERELSAGLSELNHTLEQANLSFASALVATLDARDRYTAGHSAAVAVYARDIAARMGLAEHEQRLAHLCGLVHDIGKIGLPAGLLEKPGALTLDERREMQRHSEIGERILANVETYAEIASVVRHHHERMDGNGYPDGIESARIPVLARIIAVADAYNAMTSDRPYRDAMPTRVARLRLAQAVESQFDTSVVAAFEAILAGATEEYRQAKGPEFLWLETDGDELAVVELISLAG
jgi:putative nucleotidyltransferase with HDIG domain